MRSPFAGTLLLTVETDDVLTTKVIEMTASNTTVPIGITEACRPNAYVTASVIRAIDPNIKWRTHRAYGSKRITVDASQWRLATKIDTLGEIRPRSPLPVQVKVVDQAGQPVRNAAVTLAAVDEGILQITRFKTPDALSFFNAIRSLAVESHDLYSQLMPEVPRPDKTSPVGGGDEGAGGRHRSPVQSRRVQSVAMISPVLHTDESGQAKYDFQVGEFTGSLRVMALSYAGSSFGSGEKNALVRSPLMVQSSYPRFAAPSDTFQVPLIVFNNSRTSGDVRVVIDLPDIDGRPSPLRFADGKASLELPPMKVHASGQAAAGFTLSAAQACGNAKIRLRASMDNETYEENLELPVRPASPVISRGGYALAPASRPTTLPIAADMVRGTEVIDIKLTPFPTLELPSGLEYLERYPYGCAEQTISTCFPLAYLSDIGRAIAPGVFERERVAAKVQAGILPPYEHADGRRRPGDVARRQRSLAVGECLWRAFPDRGAIGRASRAG